jgi:hypothetical protein
LQLIGVVPQLARIAHVDRVALAPLDGRGYALAADGRFDDLPHVHHGEPIARDFVAPDIKIQKIAPRHTLGIDAAGTRHRLRRHLDVLANLLDLLQVRPEDFNAHWGPHSGRQHIDAGLDRHGPGIGHPRELQRLVHLGDQALIGQPWPPLRRGLELHHDLHHAEGGGISRGLRPPGLAKDALHLGKALDRAVHLLQELRRRRHRQARQRGRHV